MISFIKRFFKPNNSIVLLVDPSTAELVDQFHALLPGVEKYYELTSLSSVVNDRDRRDRGGKCAVCLVHSRKRTFFEVVPGLLERNVSFTLFLDSRTVGMNRLALGEELSWYRSFYDSFISAEEWKQWEAAVWTDPVAVEGFLSRARREAGPLQLGQMDPLDYSVTWGQVLALPRDRVELGWIISCDPRAREEILAQDLAYLRRQITGSQRGGTMGVAYYPSDAHYPTTFLRDLGVKNVVVGRRGAIDADTDPMEVPSWQILKSQKI